jgi:uncharacterized membrane protein YgdD (TMEM256/DUF423 family)
MSPSNRFLLCFAAASLCAATALGAYASHGLGSALDAARLAAFATAVEYQFYHGLGLLAVTLLGERFPASDALQIAGWLLVAGTVLFCGSIYATTAGVSGIGLAAPLGGLCFIAGWLVLAVAAWRLRRGGSEARPSLR